MGRAEGWAVITLFDRDSIVNDDWCLYSIDIDEDAVDTSLVGFFGAQNIIDLVWEFTHGTHDSKQVAVAQVALLDVIWVDSIDNHARVLINLSDSLPLHVVVNLLLVFWHVVMLVINGLDLSREVFVTPLLSLGDHRVDKLNGLVTLPLGFSSKLLSLSQWFGWLGSLLSDWSWTSSVGR